MSTAETFADWMHKLVRVAPPCQMQKHDICDERTAEFVADHPEFAPYDCHCNCHIDRYIAERDRARSVATALKQGLALKDEAIEQLRALHGCYVNENYWQADELARQTRRILDSLAARIEAANKDYDEKEQEQ